MSSEADDRIFDELVRRSFVAKGFRPSTDEAVEAILDALGGSEIDGSKLARMLRKVRREEPMGWEHPTNSPVCAAEEANETRELVEMFRAKGEEISEDIAEKLSELERKAAEEPDGDE